MDGSRSTPAVSEKESVRIGSDEDSFRGRPLVPEVVIEGTGSSPPTRSRPPAKGTAASNDVALAPLCGPIAPRAEERKRGRRDRDIREDSVALSEHSLANDMSDVSTPLKRPRRNAAANKSYTPKCKPDGTEINKRKTKSQETASVASSGASRGTGRAEDAIMVDDADDENVPSGSGEAAECVGVKTSSIQASGQAGVGDDADLEETDEPDEESVQLRSRSARSRFKAAGRVAADEEGEGTVEDDAEHGQMSGDRFGKRSARKRTTKAGKSMVRGQSPAVETVQGKPTTQGSSHTDVAPIDEEEQPVANSGSEENPAVLTDATASVNTSGVAVSWASSSSSKGGSIVDAAKRFWGKREWMRRAAWQDAQWQFWD